MYVRTGWHSGGMAKGRVKPIAGTYVHSNRAWNALDRNSSFPLFGLFLWQRKICFSLPPSARVSFAKRLNADGLTMRKVADISPWSAEVAAATASPLRRSPRRAHGTLQPVYGWKCYSGLLHFEKVPLRNSSLSANPKERTKSYGKKWWNKPHRSP